MKRRITTADENPTLDMSSLIDVSFLLLIYFIVTSTLDPKESDIGMTLPVPPGGVPLEPMDIDLMRIEVDSQGQILVNEELLDTNPESREVPLLLDRLATYADAARVMDSEPVVIVEADDAAKGQRFVDVLNALAHDKVKITKVTIPGFTE